MTIAGWDKLRKISVCLSNGDAAVEWVPSTESFYDYISFYTTGDLPNITELTFNQTEMYGGVVVGGTSSLQKISFPNLVTVNPLVDRSAAFQIANNSALTELLLPKLATMNGLFIIGGNANLTSLDLGSIESFSGNISITGNVTLTTIDLSSFVPTLGNDDSFAANALSAATVNAILSRYVANASFTSGSVDLSDGTNAAPTGQGLTDVATLTGRGVTVTVNS